MSPKLRTDTIYVRSGDGIVELPATKVTLSGTEQQLLTVYDGETIVGQFTVWSYWRWAEQAETPR